MNNEQLTHLVDYFNEMYEPNSEVIVKTDDDLLFATLVQDKAFLLFKATTYKLGQRN